MSLQSLSNETADQDGLHSQLKRLIENAYRSVRKFRKRFDAGAYGVAALFANRLNLFMEAGRFGAAPFLEYSTSVLFNGIDLMLTSELFSATTAVFGQIGLLDELKNAAVVGDVFDAAARVQSMRRSVASRPRLPSATSHVSTEKHGSTILSSTATRRRNRSRTSTRFSARTPSTTCAASCKPTRVSSTSFIAACRWRATCLGPAPPWRRRAPTRKPTLFLPRVPLPRAYQNSGSVTIELPCWGENAATLPLPSW